ncbi:MAG: hypothetical protein BMS9Abin36_0341 [Gammaproteobacteria bacterium]|nr:MAG: hypothetical protein BMS9Abin36_0341 [Gammaproteobacteria bacterium]
MNRLFQTLAISLAMVLAAPAPAAERLPMAKDFKADARVAARERKPIVVFFSSEDCSYCAVVHELYLEPMYRDSKYSRTVVFREVDVDGILPVRDFMGKSMDHTEFADQEGATFTPLIKFYGARGEEVAPELLGYSSPDFYQGFLEAAIETALARSRDDKVARQ